MNRKLPVWFLGGIIALVLCLAFSSPARATDITQAEAIQWIQSKVDTTIDYDGYYGGQCVDLIMAYYNYLGVNPANGNGSDYATNALPSGWTRVQGGVPQAGDILIYDPNASNPYGHVAIFEAEKVTYHQNYNNEQWVHKIANIRYNGFTNTYWGYIRPNFAIETLAPQKEFTLTYHINGGSGAIPASKASTNEAICSIQITNTIPQRENFTFLGWALSSDASEASYLQGDTIRLLEQETVLYAVWQANAAQTGPQNGWVKENGQWVYYNGTSKTTGWLQEGDIWYYLDKTTGEMVTGWKQLGGIWYYFLADGTMATGTCTIQGVIYRFDNSGAWISARNGWEYNSGTWYYYQNGSAITGWKLLGGIWYYFDAQGRMLDGWQLIGGIWYYFDDGAMVTGSHLVDGKMYAFTKDGAWIHTTGWVLYDTTWYYCRNGLALTGWQLLGSTWYYFDDKAQMVTGQYYIDGTNYFFDNSGAWIE